MIVTNCVCLPFGARQAACKILELFCQKQLAGGPKNDIMRVVRVNQVNFGTLKTKTKTWKMPQSSVELKVDTESIIFYGSVIMSDPFHTAFEPTTLSTALYSTPC